MPIFRRKKEEEIKKEEPKPISEDVEKIKEIVEEDMKKEELPKKPEERIEKPVVAKKPERFAPLFVKIEKYKEILTLLTELKKSIDFYMKVNEKLEEIKKLEAEMEKIKEEMVKKINSKIVMLDEYFLRPKEFEEKLPKPIEPGIEDFDSVVRDLKSEVESIRKKIEE